MALFMGDVVIKTAIEMGLNDLRKKDWVIEEIFSAFVCNPFLKEKYGMKEIDRAKEWVKNNKIHIFMAHRLDTEAFPCVTIAMGDSNEDNSMTSLADQHVDTIDLGPESVGEELSWIVNPFSIVTQDLDSGEVIVPRTIDLTNAREGMLLVDASNGETIAQIREVVWSGFRIDSDIELTSSTYGIAPRFSTYKARFERIVSNEQYNIGCHAHGDPMFALFLFAFVKYSLLRYREGMLEGCGFQNSTIKCTDMIKNTAFSAENIYSRFISLTGQAQEEWVKEPMPYIEATQMVDSNSNGNSNKSGIVFISNEHTIEDSEEDENDLWITIDGEE